jgi:hypothetical protein
MTPFEIALIVAAATLYLFGVAAMWTYASAVSGKDAWEVIAAPLWPVAVVMLLGSAAARKVFKL